MSIHHTLGSVLGFVYRNEKLLRPATDIDNTNRNNAKSEMVSMGWFDTNGQRSFGVELVDRSEDLNQNDAPRKIHG